MKDVMPRIDAACVVLHCVRCGAAVQLKARSLLRYPGDHRNHGRRCVMKKQLGMVAAGVLAVVSGPALAQDGENSEGFYLGYGLGEFSSDVDLATVDDVDLDSDDAQKIFGGWRFNRWLAVNLDYTDFGDSRGALNVSADTEGLTPGVIGTLPLGPIELYGKIGVMFYDVTIDAGGPLVDSSGEDAVLGFGIGATFFERFNLRGEYERVDLDRLDDAEAVWLTASWRF
jgi:hypothetical protein